MKYDITKKNTKRADKVINSHINALFSILSTTSFEEITVGKICEISGYPRATFYNYFDDKYDLLHCCMQSLSSYVGIEKYSGLPINSMIEIYLSKLYDIMQQHETEVHNILIHNLGDGYFVASCKLYLIAEIKKMLDGNPLPKNCPVPKDIMAEHYANIILLVSGKRYDSSSPLSKYEATAYVKYLSSIP